MGFSEDNEAKANSLAGLLPKFDSQVMAGGLEELYLTRPDTRRCGLVFLGNRLGPIVDLTKHPVERARDIIPGVALSISPKNSEEIMDELYVVNLRYNPLGENMLFCSGDVYRLQNLTIRSTIGS